MQGLNALLATISTPLAAPVIAGCRLRKGSTNSAWGESRLVADALVSAKAAGATGLVILRADSAFYSHDVLAAIARHRARFSVTARQDPSVRRAISAIPDTAWTPIHYPNAIWDEQTGELISDAEVAETGHLAFTSRLKAEHVSGRLIVRRVRRLNPTGNTEQGELFSAWRYHAVFTNSPLSMHDAEAAHRGHAINRAGHRRAEERPAGIAALRGVHRQRCLAGPRLDRVQSHPRHRLPGLRPPRPSTARDDPHPADQRARPAGPLGPKTHDASARALALAAGLGAAPRARSRRTSSGPILTSWRTAPV